MTTLRTHTVRHGYSLLCKLLRDRGRQVSPRGQGCRELTGATVLVERPDLDAMPVGIGRGVNEAIGALEALQLVAGVSTPELLVRASPNFAAFRDGEAFHGAYGPRVRWQLAQVERRLHEDPDTRQAVLSIWEPSHDLYGEARDVPCTLSLQFLLRGGRLECVSVMRSNDVWWGLAYDIFQFAAVQQVLAASLGVEVGTLIHHAGSLHLYDRDLERVDKLTPPSPQAELAPRITADGEPVAVAQRRAQALLEGKPLTEQSGDDPPAEFNWYRMQVGRFFL